MLNRTILVLMLAAPALLRADPSEPMSISNEPLMATPPRPIELPMATPERPPAAAWLSQLAFTEPDGDVAARQRELKLRSAAALVLELGEGQLLYGKNTDAVMPIASITKLMTAIVVLDSGLPLDEPITI